MLQRAPFILQFVLDLLGEAGEASIACQAMTIDEQGKAMHTL